MSREVASGVSIEEHYSGESIVGQELEDEIVVIFEDVSGRAIQSVVPLRRLDAFTEILEHRETDGDYIRYDSPSRTGVSCPVCEQFIRPAEDGVLGINASKSSRRRTVHPNLSA